MSLGSQERPERSIPRIEDGAVRSQFIRLGIGEESLLKCVGKIPFGPFMLRHNRQEIAVGLKIAKKIRVRGGSRS